MKWNYQVKDQLEQISGFSHTECLISRPFLVSISEQPPLKFQPVFKILSITTSIQEVSILSKWTQMFQPFIVLFLQLPGEKLNWFTTPIKISFTLMIQLVLALILQQMFPQAVFIRTLRILQQAMPNLITTELPLSRREHGLE